MSERIERRMKMRHSIRQAAVVDLPRLHELLPTVSTDCLRMIWDRQVNLAAGQKEALARRCPEVFYMQRGALEEHIPLERQGAVHEN